MPTIVLTPVRSTARLDQLMLLIEVLGLLAPLRRLVLPILLFLVTFLFSLVHSTAVVLGRAIYSHQFKWLRLGSVDELVLGARRHDDNV